MSCKYCDFAHPSEGFHDTYAEPIIENPYGWDVVLRRTRHDTYQIVSKDHYTATCYARRARFCPVCGRKL